MTDVWYAIPSKRPAAEANQCLDRWRAMGYKVAVFVDKTTELPKCDLWIKDEYHGYAQAVNQLVSSLLIAAKPDWIVTGGDDVFPDAQHTAQQIALQCGQYFGSAPRKSSISLPGSVSAGMVHHNPASETFGVMQPIGDRYGADELHLGQRGSAYIDRVCGSPWMGREFCERINQGRGPFWPDYFHAYSDEELFEVATSLGILWQRPDLIHLHQHWARARKLASDMPEFLARANSGEEWNRAQRLFNARKAAGFPGHEPLPIGARACN